MKKYLFLTSAITLCTLCPAMAETFPTNGLMQENKTYDNAAIEDNMDGVYEDTVNAVAQYENALYQLAAGQYLPANSETPTDCDQNGYYCAGNSNGVNYSSSAQGLSQCPAGYTNSGTGASSEDDCYRACTVQNANIAHASAVSGNDYYGNGTDTCSATACEHGYHPQAGLDLNTTIGTDDAAYLAAEVEEMGGFVEFDASTEEMSNNGMNYYGISSNDHKYWAVDYGTGKGIISGHRLCSTQQGDNNGHTWTNPTTFATLTDETGQEGARYCYCNVTGYKASGSAPLQSLSSPWVFGFDTGAASHCASDCEGFCADRMRNTESNYLAFRAALLGSVSSGPASCAANTITINWSDVDPDYAGQNNEGTAVYGEDINTPVKAVKIPGKNFTGWKFVNPNK